MNLPESVDLRSDCTPVRDQGDLAASTSFAAASAIEFLEASISKLKKFFD
jgi:hypothetical protein